MSDIEIIAEERTFTVDTIDDLVDLVRSGRVGRAAQVKLPEADEYVRADSLPQVAGVLAKDPWSAWEAEPDDSLLDAFTPPKPTPPPVEKPVAPAQDVVEELPASALVPMMSSSEEVEKVVEVAKPKAAPDPERPITPSSTTHPPRNPRRPPGKVIAFPQSTDNPIDGMHALAMDLTPRNQTPRVDHYSSVRWSRVIVLGVVGVAVTMMWVWYVQTNATAQFSSRSKVAVQATPKLPAPMSEVEIEKEVSPYETLEDTLRNELMEGILDIPGETEFEDALLIELRRVRVDVRSVRVKINTWAGRKNDIPDDVSFQVKVVARDGELDRDLGGLGLVLGKYIQHYGLQVSSLDILLSAEDGLRKIRMNPETARRYFTHRVSLERFLTSGFAAE